MVDYRHFDLKTIRKAGLIKVDPDVKVRLKFTGTPGDVVPRPVPPDVRRRRFLVSVANHSLLIAVGAMFTLPFAFVILTSLMTTDQALTADLWP